MSTRETIVMQFKNLINEGSRILTACRWDGDNYNNFPDINDYLRYRTQVANLIRRACGEDSDHYREIRRLAEAQESASNSYYFAHCVGVLEAAGLDFEGGLLFDLRRLISAELLGNLLEQAEFLVTEGYHVPAASLAGAVLEDTLRKLCDKHGITYPKKTKIDSLNSELAKRGIYTQLTQKQITAWADVRNNADHGHFDKFTAPDVAEMVKWVRRFAEEQMR